MFFQGVVPICFFHRNVVVAPFLLVVIAWNVEDSFFDQLLHVPDLDAELLVQDVLQRCRVFQIPQDFVHVIFPFWADDFVEPAESGEGFLLDCTLREVVELFNLLLVFLLAVLWRHDEGNFFGRAILEGAQLFQSPKEVVLVEHGLPFVDHGHRVDAFFGKHVGEVLPEVGEYLFGRDRN